MITGPLTLAVSALVPLAAASPVALDRRPITAVLLRPDSTPDMSVHTRFGDISASEIEGADYARQRLTGTRFEPLEEKAVFRSDPISFGSPVSLPPFRFLALVEGTPSRLLAASRLLGVMDLSPSGHALEVSNAALHVTVPETGWFQLQRL